LGPFLKLEIGIPEQPALQLGPGTAYAAGPADAGAGWVLGIWRRSKTARWC